MPIFDQGYQHWSGELSGHGWRWLAIARNGVRAGMKNWLIRIAMLMAWVPAVMLAAFLCMWGLMERKSAIIRMFFTIFNPGIISDPKHYRVDFWTLAYHYFLFSELYISMGIILLVGPSLISQDLRFNALPLYFSRPLRRFDYFVGKLSVIAAFLAMVIILPSVAAYILGLLFTLDITIIRDTFRLLLSVVAYGAIFSVSAGMLMLALSALSRSSRYVMLMWLAMWFISGATGIVLEGVEAEQRMHVYNRRIMAAEKIPDIPRSQMTPADFRRARLARRQAQDQAQMDYERQIMTIGDRDWRPLVSYTSNIERVERALLRTDAAWEDLSLLDPPQFRPEFLAGRVGPEYPWYWSAAVLAGLFGLSACILHFPIRSLDRLR
jgi:ABC-2 type transport system permease protein